MTEVSGRPSLRKDVFNGESPAMRGSVAFLFFPLLTAVFDRIPGQGRFDQE